MIPQVLNVQYRSTGDPVEAQAWLDELEAKGISLAAFDFETMKRYTEEEIELLQSIADDPNTPYLEKKSAESVLASTALDHPVHSEITHLSVATSDDEAFVIVTHTDELRRIVLKFLIETEIKQLWHNASYDFKHIYFHTNQFPKNYEDTQVFAKTLINHADSLKARTGLKELAGSVYGDWGLASEDFVNLDPWAKQTLKYAATDAAATFWVWQRCLEGTTEMQEFPDTDPDYSPWDQLETSPNPIGQYYPDGYFYHHTAKHLVRDTVRLMMNGLPMDMNRVVELENTLEEILGDVEKRLEENSVVVAFKKKDDEQELVKYRKEQREKMRSPDHYYQDFNPGNAVQRSHFMEIFAKRVGLPSPEETYDTGLPKWSARLVKKLSSEYPPLRLLANKMIPPSNPTAKEAAWRFAAEKAERFNRRYEENIKNPKLKLQPFNPGSNQQKQAIFAWLNIESGKVSPVTGNPSWGREQVERVAIETTDPVIKDFANILLEHSFSAIVRNNFIRAFYRFTVDGVLYGSYRLLGAKSGRYTSNSPNMLNAPSTRSAFAKPIKECFVAPPGFIIATADYAA